MAEVTKPLALDETLQALVVASENIEDAIRGVSLGNYVIVNINNYTWGSVTGAGVYPAGTPVTLRATPSEDCYFLGWFNADGQILSVEPTYTFTPIGNTVIRADFNADEYVKIVSWANGTDVELNAMLDAHYRGVINIHDYWSVGDTRTVHLSAMGNTWEGEQIVSETHAEQDTEWVLMDTTLQGFTPANADDIGTRDKLAFAVGMKDCLKNSVGYINSVRNSVGWHSCSRRTWCNTIFLNAFPNALRRIFKSFTWQLPDSEGVLEESEDNFAFPVMKFLGAQGVESAAESAQFNVWEWYTTSENIPKGRSYWTSSQSQSLRDRFIVQEISRFDHEPVTNTYGLSPFGII